MNKFEIRYTNAQVKHDEFVKTQSAFSYINNESSQFKLKRFQNIQPKVGIVHPRRERLQLDKPDAVVAVRASSELI